VLELLVRASSAHGGQLYLARGGEMKLEAVYGSSELRSQLDHAVQDACTEVQTVVPAQRAGGALAVTGTLDAPWRFFDGESRSFLLTLECGGESAVVGVALLRAATWPDHGDELLHASARLLVEYGDATPVALG
jgi:hypothetical protein